MKINSSNKKDSLVKNFIVFYLFAFLLVISAIFSCISYSEKQNLKRAVSLSEDTLTLHINSLDKQLNNVSSFLSNFLLLDDNHTVLAESSDSEERLNAELAINKILEEQISLYDNISGLLFYAPWSDVLLTQGTMTESRQDRLALEEYVKEYYRTTRSPESDPTLMRWTPVSLNNHTFLVSIASYEHVYIASWYRIETILAPLTALNDEIKTSYYLSDKKENSLLSSIDSQTITPALREKLASDSAVINVSSEENNYRLWTYLQKDSLRTRYTPFFIILIFLMFLFLMLLLSNLLMIYRKVLTPVDTIIHGMKDLQKGNLNTQLPVPSTQNEFQEMITTFNYMSREIQHLKVRLYEEKLEKANTELEYLTLQIKPHFFLNCLNVIYSLNLSGQKDLLTQMTSDLMIYFRYLFKSSSSFVTLKDELEHVEAYLRIQKLRTYAHFSSEFDIEEHASTQNIPVLLIQTFVENIFKHSHFSDNDIFISISAKNVFKNEETYLHIQICDNGSGFPVEQLSTLNTMGSISKDGKHIGINNIKHRLLALYAGKAVLAFSNREEGGAMVDLWIPQSTL